MKSVIKTVLPLLTAFVLLNACNQPNEQEKLLSGDWKMLEMQMGDEVISGTALGGLSMSFNEDGSLQVNIAGEKTSGSWSFSGEQLTIVEEETTTKVNITKLDEEYLEYDVMEEGSNVHVKWARAE